MELALTSNPMTPSHAAGWSRFQRALCRLAENPRLYKYLHLSERHRDAVKILGYGTEEELKYEMHQWRMDYPKLFEEEKN
jgi:hypothetical protein